MIQKYKLKENNYMIQKYKLKENIYKYYKNSAGDKFAAQNDETNNGIHDEFEEVDKEEEECKSGEKIR